MSRNCKFDNEWCTGTDLTKVTRRTSTCNDCLKLIRSQMAITRSLLETACDAYDDGQWNSLLLLQMCGLPRAWREKAKGVLRD